MLGVPAWRHAAIDAALAAVRRTAHQTGRERGRWRGVGPAVNERFGEVDAVIARPGGRPGQFFDCGRTQDDGLVAAGGGEALFSSAAGAEG